MLIEVVIIKKRLEVPPTGYLSIFPVISIPDIALEKFFLYITWKLFFSFWHHIYRMEEKFVLSFHSQRIKHPDSLFPSL